MACNAPLAGWKSKDKTALGKRAVTFDRRKALVDLPINIRCSKCHGCRLDKSREWAMRCSHEAQMHEESCFITLTYSPEHLPTIGQLPTLRKKDFVLFMKRLRKRRKGQKILYFHCGEYGELDGRPHHHALLFGTSFSGMYYWRKSGDYNLYRSPELEKLWADPETKKNYGHAEIGQVSFESAGYVARYTVRTEGQEKEGQVKPYLTMSRRPGIGKRWLEKYISDIYPSDEVVTRHGVYKPPRYYDNQLPKEELKKITATRIAKLTEEQKSGLRSTAREMILISKKQQRSPRL